MDRSDFYYRQIVTHAEMNQAFDDVAARVQALVTDYDDGTRAAWGVMQGLEVTEQAVPDLTVQIADGVAIDAQGQRIPVTGGPTTRDLSSYVPATAMYTVWVRMYVEHDTALSDPRLDGNDDPVDYRQTDSFVFSEEAGTPGMSPTKPAIASGKVLIATVLLTNGMSQIFDNDISMDLESLALSPPDRQEGGYAVFHGRLTPSRRKINFDISPILGGEEVINLGTGNHLQAQGGTIRMATLASDGGNALFGELASIYKAGQVRVAGTIQDGGGFWYSNPTSDEYGEPLQAIGKVLQYDPAIFYPAQQTITPQDPTPAGNIWRISAFGTRPLQGPGWEYHANGTNAYLFPLFCPLVGIPFRAQLVGFEWEVECHTVRSALTFGVSVYRRGIAPTDLTMISNGGTVSLGALTVGNHQIDAGTIAHLARPDLYTYFAAFWIYVTGSISSTDSGVYVTGCRLNYEIREASGEYYHPTL